MMTNLRELNLSSNRGLTGRCVLVSHVICALLLMRSQNMALCVHVHVHALQVKSDFQRCSTKHTVLSAPTNSRLAVLGYVVALLCCAVQVPISSVSGPIPPAQPEPGPLWGSG
jgi:hypothetical protein